MSTQNNATAPPKEAVIQYYYDHNNFSEQFHSTLPPTYEQSTNPQYSPSSPNLDDILQEQENLKYNNNNGSNSNSAYPIDKNDNTGPSSPPITNSLLSSPIPSAPPVELILDDESSSLAPPPPVANPNFRSNVSPNSHPNSSSPYHEMNNPVNVIDQTKKPGSFDCTVNSLCNFLRPVKDKRNWIALIYLLFWDMDFGLFSFIWVIFTLCISIPMMVIPPIGSILLTWSVYSWRALAHIEILTFDVVCPPSDLSQKLPSSSHPPSIYFQRKPGQGCFDFLCQVLTDEFTIRSLAYFIFVKPWVSMLATMFCVTTFLFGVNFLLLPIFMPMYRDIVNFESKLGKRVLGLKNNDVMNENRNEVIIV